MRSALEQCEQDLQEPQGSAGILGQLHGSQGPRDERGPGNGAWKETLCRAMCLEIHQGSQPKVVSQGNESPALALPSFHLRLGHPVN